MCRRQHLLGAIMLGFGLGLLLGNCVESAVACACGGIVFVIFGFGGMRRK